MNTLARQMDRQLSFLQPVEVKLREKRKRPYRPDRWTGRPAPPEKRLLSALLVAGIQDYLSIEKSNRSEQLAAEMWFFAEYDPDDVFSFAWVCKYLALSPGKVRRYLRHAKEKGYTSHIDARYDFDY